MHFVPHSNLVGRHALLSASQYHWLRYSDEKMIEVFARQQAAKRGTELHAFAAEAIRLAIKLPRTKQTLNMYVNDAIGYHMTPEQILYYSDNCFGTADAIGFKSDVLRIHDLKSGITPGSMDQLKIYASLFCLEYQVRAADIGIELRIYQNDAVEVCVPELDEIIHIQDKIKTFDRLIDRLRMEEL